MGIQVIDSCDSCQQFTLCSHYDLHGEFFVWCDECQDEQATKLEIK